MAIIKVDYENNSEWWGAAQRQEWPASIRPLFADDDEVAVDDLDARRAERVFATLPGWDDGPAYAPHPVIVEYPDSVRVEVLDAVIALQEAGYRLVRSGEADDPEHQIPIGCVLVLGPCGGSVCVDDPEAILRRLRALTALESRES